MRILNKGDIFSGKSYADMINKAIGTNYQSWMKSSVDLSAFGCPNMIAWFVFMDGSEHGYGEGWKWANRLSEDGKEIDEYNVASSKMQLKKRRVDEGYYPYRLAFQLDPYGENNNHCCRFVGAFRFKSFIRKDASAVTYEKMANTFKLGSKGEVGEHLDGKDDLLPKSGKYWIPLEELGFSTTTYQILRGHIKYAGELLELGIGVEGPLADEIQMRIFECFKDDRYI